jgi:hypothetical protein
MNEALEYVEKAVKEFCDIPPVEDCNTATIILLLQSGHFKLIQSEIIEKVYMDKKEKHIYKIKDKFISIIVNYRSENYNCYVEEYDLTTIKFATQKEVTIWD